MFELGMQTEKIYLKALIQIGVMICIQLQKLIMIHYELIIFKS